MGGEQVVVAGPHIRRRAEGTVVEHDIGVATSRSSSGAPAGAAMSRASERFWAWRNRSLPGADGLRPGGQGTRP